MAGLFSEWSYNYNSIRPYYVVIHGDNPGGKWVCIPQWTQQRWGRSGHWWWEGNHHPSNWWTCGIHMYLVIMFISRNDIIMTCLFSSALSIGPSVVMRGGCGGWEPLFHPPHNISSTTWMTVISSNEMRHDCLI